MLWETHIGTVLDEHASEETEHTALTLSIALREVTDQGKDGAAHKVDAFPFQPLGDGLFGDELSTYEADKNRDRSK